MVLKKKSSAAVTESDRLTEEEKQAGWKMLFNEKTPDGWKGIGMETVPEHLWKVVQSGK